MECGLAQSLPRLLDLSDFLDYFVPHLQVECHLALRSYVEEGGKIIEGLLFELVGIGHIRARLAHVENFARVPISVVI